MNREVHVGFCEGVGVRFPRATRLRVDRANLRYLYEIAMSCSFLHNLPAKNTLNPGTYIQIVALESFLELSEFDKLLSPLKDLRFVNMKCPIRY